MSRVVHFEIPIDDPDRAGAFYRAVFGWEAQKWGPVQYWPLATGQEPGVGPGAEGALTPRAEAPEGVLVYVDVDDVGAALKTVENAGGDRGARQVAHPVDRVVGARARHRGQPDRAVPERRVRRRLTGFRHRVPAANATLLAMDTAWSANRS